MEHTALSQLHPYLKTKKDVNRLINILENLTEELFKEAFNLQQFLSREGSYDFVESFQNALKTNCPDPSDKHQMQNYIAKAQEEIEKLPIVHIILPFAPKESLIAVIHDWFLLNYKKTVVLDVAVDPDLIGGSVLSFQGRANDYSLKGQIEQLPK
jgi:hypothetical protein